MSFITLIIGIGIGLVVGWVALPEPAAFRAWWAARGWADRD